MLLSIVGWCNVHAGKAVLLCQSSKKEFYKKFLYEPLPVEVSRLCKFTFHCADFSLGHLMFSMKYGAVSLLFGNVCLLITVAAVSLLCK